MTDNEKRATIQMSSRRTIMDGEVVTFATGFRPTKYGINGWDSVGPFDVSASRDAVVVHRANIENHDDMAALLEALQHAERAMWTLRGRFGQPSIYPNDPTEVRQ